ncbi:hypothetical protein G6F19_013882 [Rhizopus arrhizus]|nr:hypothetical protein G6F19_013882 [Rhizopus arrhizus]
MSKFAIPNVDIPKLTDSEQKFQYLLNIVQELQQRVTTHDDVITELTALRTENATLKAEIANLKAQLTSPSDNLATAPASSVPSLSVAVPSVREQVPTAMLPKSVSSLPAVLLCQLTRLLLVGLSTCT